jgi:hypothetical protein
MLKTAKCQRGGARELNGTGTKLAIKGGSGAEYNVSNIPRRSIKSGFDG